MLDTRKQVSLSNFISFVFYWDCSVDGVAAHNVLVCSKGA